jgi:hypothetical protein
MKSSFHSLTDNWTLSTPPSSANCQLWNPQSNSLLQLSSLSLLSLLNHLIRAQLSNNCSHGTPELDSILILAAWDSRYRVSGRPPQKTPLPLFCLPQGVRRWRQKTPLFYFAPVCFRGNMFTEPLPSNELFRLSGIRTIVGTSWYSSRPLDH